MTTVPICCTSMIHVKTSWFQVEWTIGPGWYYLHGHHIERQWSDRRYTHEQARLLDIKRRLMVCDKLAVRLLWLEIKFIDHEVEINSFVDAFLLQRVLAIVIAALWTVRTTHARTTRLPTALFTDTWLGAVPFQGTRFEMTCSSPAARFHTPCIKPAHCALRSVHMIGGGLFTRRRIHRPWRGKRCT